MVPMIIKQLLDILVCPVPECRKPLTLASDENSLQCTGPSTLPPYLRACASPSVPYAGGRCASLCPARQRRFRRIRISSRYDDRVKSIVHEKNSCVLVHQSAIQIGLLLIQ